MTRSLARLCGFGLAGLAPLLATTIAAAQAPAEPAAHATGADKKAPKKPDAAPKSNAKGPEKAAAPSHEPETPKDAAEVEAQPPAPPSTAAAAGSESMPDPTTGPDPFRHDASASPTWASGAVSTSGSQLIPTDGPGSVTAPTGATARDVDQSARIHALEDRLATLEAEADHDRERWSWLSMFKVSGFLQPQLAWSWFNAAASPNATAGGLPSGVGANDVIARSDGTTTNPDYFRLRRARIRMEFSPSEYAKAVVEIDPNLLGGPTPGSGTIARNVEAIGHVPWTHDVSTDFGMGMFKVPLGHEVVEAHADRPFIERSFGSQSMFPGEFDTGIHADTHAAYERFLAQVAVINGVTIGEKAFSVVPDLNKGKDVVARVRYDFGLFELGAGGYYGQGQSIDAAALRFKQYRRWAGNLEGAVHHTFVKRLGATQVFAQLTLAQNMDRGTMYAFAAASVPAAIGDDVVNKDERSWQVRLEQDVTRWVTVGARYDAYAPDTAQADDQRQTVGVVAAVHFTKALQWMLEFDHAVDHIHAPNAPVADRKIETLSNVLQVRF